eukprot:SAG11_NODE_26273_length_347_cov_1.024194_1_plen_30_part_01
MYHLLGALVNTIFRLTDGRWLVFESYVVVT